MVPISFCELNKNGMLPSYFYTTKPESEIIKEDYPNYIICDTIDNDYQGGWIL